MTGPGDTTPPNTTTVTHFFVYTDGDGDSLALSESDGNYVLRSRDAQRAQDVMVEFAPADLRELRRALDAVLACGAQ